MQQTQEMWVPSQGGEDALVEAFQYSCQENPIDKGAWRATVHRVAKSRTRLSDFTLCMDGGAWWATVCEVTKSDNCSDLACLHGWA